MARKQQAIDDWMEIAKKEAKLAIDSEWPESLAHLLASMQAHTQATSIASLNGSHPTGSNKGEAVQINFDT